MHLLVVHPESVAAQQDVQSPRTEGDPSAGEVVQPPAECRVVRPFRPVPNQSPRDAKHPTRAPLAQLERCFCPAHRGAPMLWAHIFSKRLPQDLLIEREIRHHVLDFRFSSRSCFSSRSSLTSKAGEPLLPAIERGLRDPQLAADVDDRVPVFAAGSGRSVHSRNDWYAFGPPLHEFGPASSSRQNVASTGSGFQGMAPRHRLTSY
jgi:hypothetical protein